jgi:hypothetical protein
MMAKPLAVAILPWLSACAPHWGPSASPGNPCSVPKAEERTVAAVSRGGNECVSAVLNISQTAGHLGLFAVRRKGQVYKLSPVHEKASSAEHWVLGQAGH